MQGWKADTSAGASAHSGEFAEARFRVSLERLGCISQGQHNTERVQRLIHQELGIECFVDLVPRNTLPRTTSGKLSRSKARKEFLRHMGAECFEGAGSALFAN